MSKITGSLGALKDRHTHLTAQRDAAKIALEKAKAERQLHLLDGDIGDTKKSEALQDKVTDAESKLAGFDEAIEEQNRRITIAAQALDKEQRDAKQKAESEALAADVVVIKSKISPWLADTRQLATLLSKHEVFRFEAGSIARFLVNASNEVEIALSVTVPDLERGVINILNGSESAPVEPAPLVKAPQTQPAPTISVCSLKPVAWLADGVVRKAAAGTDINLSPQTARHAIKINAVCATDDPRRRMIKESTGFKVGTPLRRNCIDLDPDMPPDDEAEPFHEPIMRSSTPPLFQVVDRGPPVQMQVARNDLDALATRNKDKT
jgi:hypothetical protein